MKRKLILFAIIGTLVFNFVSVKVESKPCDEPPPPWVGPPPPPPPPPPVWLPVLPLPPDCVLPPPPACWCGQHTGHCGVSRTTSDKIPVFKKPKYEKIMISDVDQFFLEKVFFFLINCRFLLEMFFEIVNKRMLKWCKLCKVKCKGSCFLLPLTNFYWNSENSLWKLEEST